MRDDYDFSDAKRVHEVPALAKLQAEHHKEEVAKGKTRITIYLDNDIVEAFKNRAISTNTGYQTLINDALRTTLDDTQTPLTAELLRQILHEALHTAA